MSMHMLAHQVRYDVRASLRNPRARFFTFFFPIVLLVIFTGVFGHGSTTIDGVRVKLSHFYVPGILAMSIVVAAYANLVVSISALRESGVLKRRRATPVPPALLIAGQALSTLVIVGIMATILLAIGKVAYGVGMAPAGLAALACTTVLATLTFACIGYAVSGMIGSPDAAQPIVQATTMPLWFLSGVFIPVANLFEHAALGRLAVPRRAPRGQPPARVGPHVIHQRNLRQRPARARRLGPRRRCLRSLALQLATQPRHRVNHVPGG